MYLAMTRFVIVIEMRLPSCILDVRLSYTLARIHNEMCQTNFGAGEYIPEILGAVRTLLLSTLSLHLQ
jgi:hypothetical protein